MADTYSRTELIQTWRTDHPELKQASDNEIFAAIAVDHPDLALGISELKPPSGPDRSITNPNVMGPLLGGVGPTEIGKRVSDYLAPIVNSLIPGGSTPQKNAVPPVSSYGDIGGKAAVVGAVAPLVESGVSAIGNLANKVRPIPTPAQVLIERRIGPGQGNAVQTANIAGDLAKTHPDLATVKPGEPFRNLLFNKLQNAGSDVQAIEATVPDSYPVDKIPMLDGMKKLKDLFDSSEATKASAVVSKQMDKLTNAAGAGQYIEWKDFYPIKQQLGQDLKELGVWKRLGTQAEKTTDVALARTYGQYMQATSQASDELSQANQQFSLLHDATRFSGIDPATGRYIPEIGKTPTTLVQRVMPYAIGGTLGALGVRGGYSLYRALTGGVP